ncbi:hypothetical protein NKH77_43400 [Streptomyces sp. M19]
MNIEDGRADGSLVAVDRHREVIAAVKERVPRLFVNARTDTHWSGRATASRCPRRCAGPRRTRRRARTASSSPG